MTHPTRKTFLAKQATVAAKSCRRRRFSEFLANSCDIFPEDNEQLGVPDYGKKTTQQNDLDSICRSEHVQVVLVLALLPFAVEAY